MYSQAQKQTINYNLKSAVRAFRTGDIAMAEKLVTGLMRKEPFTKREAIALQCEIFFRTRQVEKLEETLRANSLFTKDIRWKVMWGRLMNLKGEPELAEKAFSTLLTEGTPNPIFRIAAFEVVKIMDKTGRYDEAWSLASKAHRKTTNSYPLDLMEEALRVTSLISTEEIKKIPIASHRAVKTAFIHGLPRSGTSLLEQMLDLHTMIKGVGETSMTGRMGDKIAAEGGGWPVGVLHVKQEFLDELQCEYQRQVRDFHNVPEDIWTVDKTVFPMIQPLVVSVTLPGAKVIRITRSAKDNAVSLFLNNMDPSWGFTSSLTSIYRFIQAERKYAPVIYHKMGVDNMHVNYAEFVAQPEAQMRQILGFLGLAFEAQCLSPQNNKRVVHTLSHDQVIRPVNSEGIDRWRNYERYFDNSWDELDRLVQ